MRRQIILQLFFNIFIFLSVSESISCSKKILFLSDVHLDLLYNSPTSNNLDFLLRCKNSSDFLTHDPEKYDYGRYSCNPSEVLIQTVLKDAKLKNKELDLVILGGDMIAHGLYDLDLHDQSKQKNKELYRQTFHKVISIIREQYPYVKILPVHGNNDYYEHYQSPDESSKIEQIKFLKSLYFNETEHFFDPNQFNQDFNDTISHGMYYSYFDLNLGVRFISLNSNMFSIKNNKISEEESEKQLDFLERELQNMHNKNEKGFLMFHIPPYPQYVNNKTEFFFYENFAERMESLVYKYKANIINTLCGHLHWSKGGVRSFDSLSGNYPGSDTDKLISKYIRFTGNNFLQPKVKKIKYFSLINFPSVSPVFKNNPGYSVINFSSEKKRIVNIETHFADLHQTLDDNDEFSKNIEVHPEMLFSNVFSYRDDFLFSEFNDDDFYDFIYKRLEMPTLFRNYQLFIAGYSKSLDKYRYEKYLTMLIKGGMIDISDNFKIFKCSHKVMYTKELNNCSKLDK